MEMEDLTGFSSFFIDGGIMRYIASREEMQQIDSYSIEHLGIPGIVLMERAALAIKEEITSRFDKSRRFLIVCEKGNNGGDGLALARMLIHEDYRADVVEVGEISHASDSYQIQKNILDRLGITILHEIPDREYDVIVDAIFGVGLTREVRGNHARFIMEMNKRKGFKIALDVPSGVDATSGYILGTGFHADLTITVGFSKIGLLLYPGAACAGEIVVKDIGFPELARQHVQPGTHIFGPEDLGMLPRRNAWSNKGSYGKVLLVVGSKGMAGAAILSARAAYKSGCGLVRVFTAEENREIIQSSVPEAILTTFGEDDPTQETVGKLKEAIAWASVIGIGPGLGQSPIARTLLLTVLEQAQTPLVIDADGLNILARLVREERGQILYGSYRGGLIITPHLMEMSRLIETTVRNIKRDLIKTARKLAGPEHIVVLKDARTIVTDGSDSIYINTSGNHGMAVAGSGDVLTGIICGFLAGGMKIFDAARLGCYCHGLAGDAAARQEGYYSLMAGDLVTFLPDVIGGRIKDKRGV